MIAAACLILGLLAATDEPDPAGEAFKKLAIAAAGTNWPEEAAARAELAALGPPAVEPMVRAIRHHEDARVRRACFDVLRGDLEI